MRKTEKMDGVIMTSVYCEETNLLIKRFYALLSTTTISWDRLCIRINTMVDEYDLDVKLWESSKSAMVTIKTFGCLREFNDYAINKYKGKAYSYKIKGNYIKLVCNKAVYVYKIKN